MDVNLLIDELCDGVSTLESIDSYELFLSTIAELRKRCAHMDPKWKTLKSDDYDIYDRSEAAQQYVRFIVEICSDLKILLSGFDKDSLEIIIKHLIDHNVFNDFFAYNNNQFVYVLSIEMLELISISYSYRNMLAAIDHQLYEIKDTMSWSLPASYQFFELLVKKEIPVKTNQPVSEFIAELKANQPLLETDEVLLRFLVYNEKLLNQFFEPTALSQL